MTETPLEVTEEQVLYFRAMRGGLLKQGLSSPQAAAGALLGAQAQIENPALLGLSQRVTERPTAEALKTQLWEERSLIRTWGQRDTVHVYDIHDWADIIAARPLWAQTGRRGEPARQEELEEARAHLATLEDVFTRQDLYEVVPQRLAEELSPVAQTAGQDPIHFAAGRLIWHLAHAGLICTVYKQGSQQAYAYRPYWCPELEWPETRDPIEAAAHLTLRYLSTYGPASKKDVGHFFGARMNEVNQWFDRLHEEGMLLPLQCEGHPALWLSIDDEGEAALRTQPPQDAEEWPVRLLPPYDSMLMGHADKSWTVPDEAERKLIWKKAAVVCAVVLARGRIIATWSQKATKKRLKITIQPLSGWQSSQHKAAVEREAEAIAAHMGRTDTEVHFT